MLIASEQGCRLVPLATVICLPIIEYEMLYLSQKYVGLRTNFGHVATGTDKADSTAVTLTAETLQVST